MNRTDEHEPVRFAESQCSTRGRVRVESGHRGHEALVVGAEPSAQQGLALALLIERCSFLRPVQDRSDATPVLESRLVLLAPARIEDQARTVFSAHDMGLDDPQGPLLVPLPALPVLEAVAIVPQPAEPPLRVPFENAALRDSVPPAD